MRCCALYFPAISGTPSLPEVARLLEDQRLGLRAQPLLIAPVALSRQASKRHASQPEHHPRQLRSQTSAAGLPTGLWGSLSRFGGHCFCSRCTSVGAPVRCVCPALNASFGSPANEDEWITHARSPDRAFQHKVVQKAETVARELTLPVPTWVEL
ncbi:hypothetical protein HPB50_006428 [Hyalomma asiaticum]|uniref:Uncharacterized protein n=1 Tax=Hyalomma asiaticum TaxID=266040 RepID=A0ACB7S5H5_HYAAI|nr:hypothetical protein HPB50_006428 [Hyalomma asiaticum]